MVTQVTVNFWAHVNVRRCIILKILNITWQIHRWHCFLHEKHTTWIWMGFSLTYMHKWLMHDIVLIVNMITIPQSIVEHHHIPCSMCSSLPGLGMWMSTSVKSTTRVQVRNATNNNDRGGGRWSHHPLLSMALLPPTPLYDTATLVLPKRPLWLNKSLLKHQIQWVCMQLSYDNWGHCSGQGDKGFVDGWKRKQGGHCAEEVRRGVQSMWGEVHNQCEEVCNSKFFHMIWQIHNWHCFLHEKHTTFYVYYIRTQSDSMVSVRASLRRPF